MKTFCLLVGCIFFIFSTISIWFANTLPREDLRMELLLATWAIDTSGLSRPVNQIGTWPQYKIDPTYNMPFAQFGWSGGIMAITGWNGSNIDDFTLSMWVKVKPQDLPPSTGMYLPSTFVANYGYVWSATTQYLATIFSSHLSQTVDALSVRLRKDFQCALGGVKQAWASYLDSINNPTILINCTKLSDGKWHFILARRQNRTLTFQIDNDTVYTGSNTMAIGRSFSIGYYPLPAQTGSLVYQMWQNWQLTNAYSSFTGGISKLRFYSRALSLIELAQLRDENILTQSDLLAAGTILFSLESYVSPMLQLTLSGVPIGLSNTGLIYQFAVNNGTYQDISSGSITAIPTMTKTLSYRIRLNLSWYPEGNTSVLIRTKSGSQTTLIGTVKFIKMDQSYGIIVNEPSVSPSISKALSASLVWSGVLTMSITRWNTCDATLMFEVYSDMVFTSKSDNFNRVCYRAEYPNIGKILYKLSNPIQGITWPSNAISGSKIFDDYLLWTKSSYARSNDSAHTILDLLAVNATATNGTINGISVMDINGDWLVDFLYSRSDPVRRAIIVNNGNYVFKIVYRCAIDSGPVIYYGDCADPTR